MIYLIYGNDTEKALKSANNLVKSLRLKKPNASFLQMNADDFNIENIKEFIFGGQGLFENKCLIFLKKVFENKEAKEFIKDNLKEISASGNVFVLLEGKLDKKTTKDIEKKAFGVKEFFTDNKKENKPEFNIFSIADNFSSRDRKGTWVLFQSALLSGVSPEEVHGILFWQIKNMVIAKNTSAKEAMHAGIKPFVFNKSLRTSKNFKEGELEKVSSEMVAVYHRARLGQEDFEIGLEKLILNI